MLIKNHEPNSLIHTDLTMAVQPYIQPFVIALLALCLITVTMDNANHTNSSELRIAAWNMRGLGTAGPYLMQLLDQSDIVAVSEHCLYTNELYRLRDIHVDFDVYANSSSDLDGSNHSRIPGHCGVAVFWRKTLTPQMKVLRDLSNDRMCVLCLSMSNKKLYLFSVYLPHRTCRISAFREAATERCLLDGDVIIIGDTNCHVGPEVGSRGWGQTTTNAQHLLNMAERRNLWLADMHTSCTWPNYTYFRENSGRSYIDHSDCMVSTNLRAQGVQCHVVPDSPVNTSDHLALVAILVGVSDLTPLDDELNGGCERLEKPCWHKCSAGDIHTRYTVPLQHKLEQAIADGAVVGENTDAASLGAEDIDSSLASIVSCMLETARENLPHSKYNPKLKPYWKPKLTTLSREQKHAWRDWIDQGSPRDSLNSSWVKYKAAKRDFRREQRSAQSQLDRELAEQLRSASNADQRLMWHIVNRVRKTKKTTAHAVYNVGGKLVTDPDSIRDSCKQYYTTLFSPTELPEYDNAHRAYDENQLDRRQVEGEDNQNIPRRATVDEVPKLCKDMKTGKAGGWDQILPEHGKHGGPTLHNILTVLFNAITITEHVSTHFKKGVVIPIPKGVDKDLQQHDNYRGITLLPVLGKLYEKCILQQSEPLFASAIEDMQGAAHHGCSSLHTSLLLREAITHNLEQDSAVYVCLLDTKKAFDTVWIKGLLFKLQDAGITGKLEDLTQSQWWVSVLRLEWWKTV